MGQAEKWTALLRWRRTPQGMQYCAITQQEADQLVHHHWLLVEMLVQTSDYLATRRECDRHTRDMITKVNALLSQIGAARDTARSAARVYDQRTRRVKRKKKIAARLGNWYGQGDDVESTVN